MCTRTQSCSGRGPLAPKIWHETTNPHCPRGSGLYLLLLLLLLLLLMMMMMMHPHKPGSQALSTLLWNRVLRPWLVMLLLLLLLINDDDDDKKMMRSARRDDNNIERDQTYAQTIGTLILMFVNIVFTGPWTPSQTAWGQLALTGPLNILWSGSETQGQLRRYVYGGGEGGGG